MNKIFHNNVIYLVLSLAVSLATSYGGDRNLTIEPTLGDAKIVDDVVELPFEVANTGTDGILMVVSGNLIDRLMTSDDNGKAIDFDKYCFERIDKPAGSFFPGTFFSGPKEKVLLEPGKKLSLIARASMRDLKFALDNHKLVFGRMNAEMNATGEAFSAESAPFLIPKRLTEHPWSDLGTQSYFSVKPEPGNISQAILANEHYVYFPVKVSNTTSQPYIAAVNSIRFFRLRDGFKDQPAFWEFFLATEPILKSGETGVSTGRCEIWLETLKQMGYKPGDKFVAVVGGRIPNTNQIFECYSNPFELPPIPEELLKRK